MSMPDDQRPNCLQCGEPYDPDADMLCEEGFCCQRHAIDYHTRSQAPIIAAVHQIWICRISYLARTRIRWHRQETAIVVRATSGELACEAARVYAARVLHIPTNIREPLITAQDVPLSWYTPNVLPGDEDPLSARVAYH